MRRSGATLDLPGRELPGPGTVTAKVIRAVSYVQTGQIKTLHLCKMYRELLTSKIKAKGVAVVVYGPLVIYVFRAKKK